MRAESIRGRPARWLDWTPHARFAFCWRVSRKAGRQTGYRSHSMRECAAEAGWNASQATGREALRLDVIRRRDRRSQVRSCLWARNLSTYHLPGGSDV